MSQHEEDADLVVDLTRSLCEAIVGPTKCASQQDDTMVLVQDTVTMLWHLIDRKSGKPVVTLRQTFPGELVFRNVKEMLRWLAETAPERKTERIMRHHQKMLDQQWQKQVRIAAKKK